MAYTYQGDAILGVSLSIETPKPLDTRTVVNNTKDLYDVPTNQAYRGMTVSNLEDGNIYMLIDENKITTSDGWKSSESALQIVSCTLAEYNKLAENTKNDFKPIDSTKPCLLQSVYYYIYEEEGQQAYLDSKWGASIEDQLSKKASSDDLTNVSTRLTNLTNNLNDNYTTTNTLIETYATLELVNSMVNLEDAESVLSKALAPYYTSSQVDDKFVTKASLGGDLSDLGDGNNLVFVPSAQYAVDKQAIEDELAQTLKVNSDGSLNSITVGQIKSQGDNPLVVDVKSDGLYIGKDPIATQSDIPVIITLSKAEYDDLEEKDKDAYYYIFDEENNKLAYVTVQELETSYSTTAQTMQQVAEQYYSQYQIDNIIKELQTKEDSNAQIQSYYTKDESDEKFLTKDDASSTYATQTSVQDLETNISTNYVTKSQLQGGDGLDGDVFKFVTESKYAQDRESDAAKFSTNELESPKITTSELIIQEIDKKEVVQEGDVEGEQITKTEVTVLSEALLSTKGSRLMQGDKQIALTEEVPVIIHKTKADYEAIIGTEDFDKEAYYFIEEATENELGGYVTYEYVDGNFISKTDCNQSIYDTKQDLMNEIEALKQEISELKSLLFPSINNKVLTLGHLDSIQDGVLILNTGEIKDKTLTLI